MDAEPEIPISLLPIDQAKYDEWFGPSVPADEALNNVGRRSTELGLEYLSTPLLQNRCQDIASGTSHPDSLVYDTLNRYWTVGELEAMSLWEQLDEKITDIGGCQEIP